MCWYIITILIFNFFNLQSNSFVSTGVISPYQAKCMLWASDVGINADLSVHTYTDDNGNFVCTCIAPTLEKTRGQAFRLEGQEWIALK